MDYKSKYLKYKSKYLHIKKLLGGTSDELLNEQRRLVEEQKYILEQHYRTTHKQHTSSEPHNKHIEYTSNISREFLKTQIEQLKEYNFTPKIVFIMAHGKNIQEKSAAYKLQKTMNIHKLSADKIFRERANEAIMKSKDHKVVQLISQAERFQVDKSFIILFIQQFAKHIEQFAKIDDDFVERAIDNFRKTIPDLWTFLPQYWRVREDALPYLMAQPQNRPQIRDHYNFNEGTILKHRFSEPGDGLFILATDEKGDDQYYFIQIPYYIREKITPSEISLNDIIDLFDNNSSIYFIPISCQNIQVSPKDRFGHWPDGESEFIKPQPLSYTVFNNPDMLPLLNLPPMDPESHHKSSPPVHFSGVPPTNPKDLPLPSHPLYPELPPRPHTPLPGSHHPVRYNDI